MRFYFFLLLFLLCSFSTYSASLTGVVFDSEGPLVGATVSLAGKNTVTDAQGKFQFNNLEPGSFELEVRFIGYRTYHKKIEISSELSEVEITMVPDQLGLSSVTVTANRSPVERYEATVIVRAIDDRVFEQTASLSLAEGLSFTPGLRLENNCQNCGFTQLRMNGLEGAYSQILIDSRPVFSALAGIYGLEMLPRQMIERVEVIRGGGSALYGGNAIAGTVNIITKEPIQPSFQVGTQLGLINSNTLDQSYYANGSILSKDYESGLTFYASTRNRDEWDANGDDLTEMVRLKNSVFGINAFHRFNSRSKFRLSSMIIDEYRRGGGQLDRPSHQSVLSEELNHIIWNVSVAWEQYSKNEQSKWSLYSAVQGVDRGSYYGSGGRIINPGDSITEEDYLALNAYGTARDISSATGVQWYYKPKGMEKFLISNWSVILGAEWQYNDVEDLQPGYSRVLNQSVSTIGSYGQWEWNPFLPLSISLGGRFDYVHINGNYQWPYGTEENNKTLPVFVPRLTARYRLNQDLHVRASFAKGYRAPQAFDEDLHIETVGGEAVFKRLDPSLRPEKSTSYNASLQWAPFNQQYQLNVVVEGFYTELNDVFVVGNFEPLANGGSIQTIRNGSGARVFGSNFEINTTLGSDWLVQLGATIQGAEYLKPEVIWHSSPDEPNDGDTIISIQSILRTPNLYGFAMIGYEGVENWSFSLNAVLTGSMTVPHVLNAESGYTQLKQTPSFLEMSPKVKFHIDSKNAPFIEVYAGVFNVLNSFQNDFDAGVDRDAGYVYGPIRPRTFYLGFSFGLDE